MQVIDLDTGSIQGIPAGENVIEYRGIPFAAAPIGENRFKRPQPVEPWSGVQTMDSYGLPAWQEINPLIGVTELSEGALTLNVWAPKGDGPFPVMVWLHGGGFTNGTPSQLLYNGEQLARSQQVIVVNVSYRLGAWGFGYFGELAPELPFDSNLGLRDQIAALEWVQRNIAAFGGDKHKVTLFGESAGGFAVASLLAAPQAKGLFHRAVVQSGAADMVLSQQEATRIAEIIVSALPGDGSAAEKLLQATPKEIVRAQREVMKIPVERGMRTTTPQYGMPFLPVIDEFLPEKPIDAIASGAAKNIPLLAGTCHEEWNLFQYVPPFNGGIAMADLQALTEEDIKRRFKRVLPEHGEALFAAYQKIVEPHAKRALTDWYTAMESDRIFRVPTERLLSAQQQAGGQCWGYELLWSENGFGLPLGAFHVMDVPFVFGITDTPIGKMFTGGTVEAKALSDRVQKIWGNFAHHGAAEWDEWHPNQQNVMGLDKKVAETVLFQQERLMLWDEVIPKV
ncbi:MAG TPA: carboxylesterase family protein [Alcanivoracaceae bacterium]|nr:carboxylesterase family protein [Alcanivoracaceae bacterium]